MLMSTGGTVIKVPVEDVKRLGRATQGVIVMRTREGEEVSTLAPVVEQTNGEEAGTSEAPAETPEPTETAEEAAD
jgi:DNA gyrase subunit A